MAARERSWLRAIPLRMPVARPLGRRQLKGLVVILLACLHEAGARLSEATLPEEKATADVRISHSPKISSPDDAVVTWGSSERGPSSGRRLTAVNTRFKLEVITGPPPSNLETQGPSTTNIDAHAGVTYRKFIIQADSGLGVDDSKVVVKLVPYDFAAAMQTCEEVVGQMGPPFDGSNNQLGLDMEATWNSFSNSDNGFSFPKAGEWRLCYSYNGVNWEQLAPKITVVGSERVADKFWCPVSLLSREVCQNTPKDNPGCECMGKMEGYKKNNQTNELVTLGLPNPAYPSWTIMLTFMDRSCGQAPFEPFLSKTSSVTNYQGYEIHNMGAKQPGTTLGVWKVCYCVGFDQDNGAGSSAVVTPCYREAPLDFPQTVGTLVTVDIKVRKGTTDITVYPTLPFRLVLECGSTGNTPNSPGGCMADNKVRYKIVEQKTENNLAYFDSGSGCRFLPQVETVITGAKTLGGHIGPDNCINPVDCTDTPEILGPKLPSWEGVKMDASYENNVMIDKSYDVCYCDENCLNSLFWFKAGSVTVKPVNVFFSDDGLTARVPIVNTNYYVIMQGGFGSGSWTDTGSQAREMKILRDDEAIVDKIACLSQPQPNVVSGHRLKFGNTDYTDPETVLNGASRPVGQRYGNVYQNLPDGSGPDPSSVSPNIKILEPGWFAVCYCDANCNEMPNWSVYGRTLVSGPTPGQQWTRYVGVTFDLTLLGWNFGVYDRVRILGARNELADCGSVVQGYSVSGPVKSGILRTQTTDDCLVVKMQYAASGTEIEFSKTHGLVDGDRLKLEGVNAPTILQGHMYNRDHEVFVSCDDPLTSCYKILILVRFPAAEFPLLKWDSVSWTRTSTQLFKNVKIEKASPEGRGYVVCWSHDPLKPYVGQAGKITVKDAIVMPEAALGLTTVMPNAGHSFNGGAPVIISFKTGDIARYALAEGPMQLKLVFNSEQKVTGINPYVTGMEPRTFELRKTSVNVDYDQIGEETQAMCGELFLEMWSSDPNGFPSPMGCFYDEDVVNPAQPLKQIHIVFSRKNHLKKNTKYMIVMNAQIMTSLRFDFPSTGPVSIWSMDNVYTDPFRVVELGMCMLSPENRVPPVDGTGALQLSADPDGLFEPQEGFKILGQNHPVFANKIIELSTYCRAFDTRFPDTTPNGDFECITCKREEDCGNGNVYRNVAPNPALNWCVSPIDTLCPAAGGSPTKVPAFEFALKAKYGRPILKSSIIRLFLQPLTVWNLKGCIVAMTKCDAPGGFGACSPPVCEAESVVGGTVVGISKYPVNIIKVTLPAIMEPISVTVSHTIAVGGLPLPPGGFLPTTISAELMKEGQTSPDYWDINTIATGGAKLYKQPKIIAASIVTHLGDGNSMPFKNDKGNLLYIRLVVGSNLFAKTGNAVTFQFRLPFGYKCDMTPTGVPMPADGIGVIGTAVPSYFGKLGGNQKDETHWVKEVTPTVACTLKFRQNMVYYAYSTVFVAVQLLNPVVAMKTSAEANKWMLVLTETTNNIKAPHFYLKAPENPVLTDGSLMPGYGGSVSTLGKLSNIIITPSNFGLGQQNAMDVFFKTEQEVGTIRDTVTEVWIDAPPGFDFGRYCAADQLDDTYYIPEPAEKTFRLPVGPIVECNGAPATSSDTTYNRAKVKTTGRLLKATTYGFKLVVTNPTFYIRSQKNQWRIWTYLSSDQSGVDGSYETARMNERIPVGPDTSFGCYELAMKPGNLGVTIADLRPTMGAMAPTEITFLPIIVQVPMQRAVRILAPSGYIWDFLQTEFRYKAPGRGIPPNQVVPGAEQDLPISGVPARPIAEPRNKLAIDYMQAEWIPGVVYGFIAKIRVPPLAPTTASNFFSIEFGYDGLNEADRLEAGTVMAPLVRRIINGRVGFTTSIIGRRAEISFSMRLITRIPRAGGLVILGPPNFVFATHCQPKPVSGFPELPYDSTCMFRQIPATGQLEISIIAGPKGIPAYYYRFSLMGTNPPQLVPTESAGQWVFNSFGIVSQGTVLDYRTNVSGYSVNNPMLSARIHASPKVLDCYFLSLDERVTFPNKPITNCAFEDWPFYPPLGARDDRPEMGSALMFIMQLSADSYTGKDIVVRAPEGYEFNAECKVVVKSEAIFNDTNTGGTIPSGFIQKYARWPVATKATNCYGSANVARITIECGGNVCLTAPNRYIFRIQVLKNPPQTPQPNKFLLEYNGEASEPFEGIEIWAFTNTTIIPTTTASSLRDQQTINNVTAYLRATNDLPFGGHLRVEAPSGFVIETNCRATVKVHDDEMVNISATPPGPERVALIQYVEFLHGDVKCEGDVTVSSRSRLHFINNNKYLMKGILYEFTFEVMNPLTTTKYDDPWVFTSYGDSSPNLIVDTATVPGFPINDAVQSFAFMQPNSVNALARQLMEFNMSFPMDVVIQDMIEIVAPVTFYFSEAGDSRCPGYQYLDGSMRKTAPVCGANTMMWVLQEEMVPAGTAVRFLVRVTNPPRTPEINLFQVRQISPTGKRKSSRMIVGYDIIPELSFVVVQPRPPTAPAGYCRPLVEVITGQNCSAAGSYGAVTITFMPFKPADLVQLKGRVGDNNFDFATARIPAVRVSVQSVSMNQITANLAVRPGTMAQLVIEGIRAPFTPGMAMFTITTYSGTAPTEESRVDEKLDLPSFEVLQYIDRISARVNPIYYGAVDATVSFELEPLMAIMKHDVFRITRPPGYKMIDGSFQGFRDLRFSEQGVDVDRKWSTNYETPEDYYVVISKHVAARTRILWALTVNLPAVREAASHWYFRTYRVLPQRDTDGEILDADPVPYPWIGNNGLRRDMQAIGTNDGAFLGFLLVGQVPFQVFPELRTPGAKISLLLTFRLDYTVQATNEVRLEVTAPTGYEFLGACFSKGSVIFRKCTGYRNTATLVSTVRSVTGTSIDLHLSVINPGATPLKNTWALAVFQDAAKQYVNWSPGAGYEILPMTVVFRGNNQLAVEDTGFFDFTPLKKSTSEVLYIIIIPPPGQGYRLLCTGVQELGFQGKPDPCTPGPADSQIKLRFANGTLEANTRYTIGVGILNPGGKPLVSSNRWGMLLQDVTQKTFDGNLRIQGLDLKSIPIRAGTMGWLVSTPKVMNTVSMQLRVLHPIPAAMVTKIVIGAPYGVRFMEDPSAVKISPLSLPLFEANPSEVANPSDVPNAAGPLLLLNLDTTQDVAEGMYNIRFECSNPGTTKWDNTWSLIVMKDIEVEYSHYNVGFEPGQLSPYEIAVSGSVGATSHAIRQHHSASLAFVGLAWFLSRALMN